MIRYIKLMDSRSLILSVTISFLFVSNQTIFAQEIPKNLEKTEQALIGLQPGDIPETFAIAEKTLNILENQKLSQSILQELRLLVNKVYPSRDQFLVAIEEALSIPIPADVLALILKYSGRNDLLAQARLFTGSLVTNNLVLLGSEKENVRIEIPRDTFRLDAQKVEVFSINKKPNKFIATKNVHISELGREVFTDEAIYDRTTKIIKLKGNILVKTEKQTFTGTKGYLDRTQEIVHLQGDMLDDLGEKRAKIVFFIDESEDSENLEGQLITPDSPTKVLSANIDSGSPSSTEEIPSTLWAQTIHFEKETGEVLLVGRVEMDRPQRQMYMKAEKVILNFDEQQELKYIIAEGDVCIQRPDRVVRSNKALLNEVEKTVHLEENVVMSLDGRYMSADSVDLDRNLNTEKVEAKGGRNKPIQWIIPLEETDSAPIPITCR